MMRFFEDRYHSHVGNFRGARLWFCILLPANLCRGTWPDSQPRIQDNEFGRQDWVLDCWTNAIQSDCFLKSFSSLGWHGLRIKQGVFNLTEKDNGRHGPACKLGRQKRSIAVSLFGLRQLRSRLMLPSLALSKMDIGQSLSDWNAGMLKWCTL